MKLSFAISARCLGMLLATTVAFPAAAADVDPIPSLVIDCATRALPSQRAVGETLRLYNFSQVNAARTRIMVTVAQACMRPGTRQVSIVRNLPEQPVRALASR